MTKMNLDINVIQPFVDAVNTLANHCDKHEVEVDELGYLVDSENDKLGNLITNVSTLFEKYMITLKGNPDTINIMRLEEHTDHRVRAGETDSFGWLSAVIVIKGNAKNYKLVF